MHGFRLLGTKLAKTYVYKHIREEDRCNSNLSVSKQANVDTTHYLAQMGHWASKNLRICVSQ